MLLNITFAVPSTYLVLEQLKNGPIQMTPSVAKAAADVKELTSRGFAEYDPVGQCLRLLQDKTEVTTEA